MCLSLPEAVRACADALPKRGTQPEVERRLADRLVVTQCWDALSALDIAHPLREGADCVKEAIPAMNEGDWERAGEMFAGVSRRSPYAPWRVFCRGMVCFGAGDDAGLVRAVALLPEDFVLSKTVSAWRQVLDVGNVDLDGMYNLLWEGEGNAEVLGQDLIEALQKRRLREVEQCIPLLCKAIYPEDPEAICATLLQLLGIAARNGEISLQLVLSLAKRLLPLEQNQLIAAKVGLVGQRPSHEVWHVAPAVDYLKMVAHEFPDADRQAIARGRVLEFLARSGQQGGACPFCVGSQVMDTLWQLIGKRSYEPETVFADLMLASLKADPGNREGYAFLLSLLSENRAALSESEAALREMMVQFPEDAAPCLELADLYYAKNAYRKAEGVLEEAHQRAPHDDQVLDRRAIGHIRAGDQSRNRGRWEMARKDYDRAEALARRRVVPVLFVKRLALTVAEKGFDGLDAVEAQLAALSAQDYLRYLGLILIDLDGIKRVDESVWDYLDNLLTGQEARVAKLTSQEVVALMAPVDQDMMLVFDDGQVAPVLCDLWEPLLARAEGDDVFALFEFLLACGGAVQVRVEIDRRLHIGDRDPLLLFYLAFLRHREGRDMGSRRFKEVIDRADAAQEKRMKEAASRLVQFSHSTLRQALQEFDFDILDRMFPFSGLPGIESFLNGMWDEDEEEEEDEIVF